MAEENHSAEAPGERGLSATNWAAVWAVFAGGLVAGAYIGKVPPALPALREQFAMVLQPSIVFPTTLRDNISYGRREATPQEIDDIMALAIRVNDFLCGLFLGVGIRLVDFKMECGRLWEGDMMRIVVADEISPDSCRLWDIKSSEKLDKDRFRRDMGGLVEAYTEVAKRLGVMAEGERPQGTGPVLVKG